MTSLIYKLKNFDLIYLREKVIAEYEILDMGEKCLFAVLLAFMYSGFFVFGIGFPSGVSMMPTHEGREVIYMNKLANQSDIAYGDTVSFDCSAVSTKYNSCIKRVVGKPNDRIYIKDTVVYINGKALTRRPLDGTEVRSLLESEKVSAFYKKMSSITTFAFYEEESLSGEKYTVLVGEDVVGYLSLMERLKRKNKLKDYENLKKARSDVEGSINMPEIVLGEDEYFLMGDNRMFSTDSTEYGAINWSLVSSKIEMTLFDLPSF